MPFTAQGLIIVISPRSKLAKFANGPGAVDRRVDDCGGPAQFPLDVIGHVTADGDDAGGLRHELGGVAVGIPDWPGRKG